MRELHHFLAACLFLIGASTHVEAQDVKLKEIRGTIRQIDLKTGALVLQPLSSDKLVPMSLAMKELPVTNSLGDKLPADQLRPELRITAQMRSEDEIAAILIDGPFQFGQVKKIDLARRTIVYKDVFAEKSITIPAAVKVVAVGKEVALSSIRPGTSIQLLTSLDGKSILQVQTGKGVNIRDPFLRMTRFTGILVELDQAQRQVRIFMQSTDAGIVKSYEVSPNAYLRTMYQVRPVKDVAFSEFARWVKVSYAVDRDTGRIINIDADLPMLVRRKVLKVNLAESLIAVEDETKEKSLSLADDVRVLTPRGNGKLADVAANRIVSCGLSLDRSRVMVVYLWDR